MFKGILIEKDILIPDKMLAPLKFIKSKFSVSISFSSLALINVESSPLPSVYE